MHRDVMKAGLLIVAGLTLVILMACQAAPERREVQPSPNAPNAQRDQQAGAMADSDAERVKARLQAEQGRSNSRPPAAGSDRSGRGTVDQPRPVRH